MALSRRTGGRSRLTIALLVLTSLALAHPRLPRRRTSCRAPAASPARCSRPLARRGRDRVVEPFANVWHGVTDYGDLKAENERAARAARRARGRARSSRRTPPSQLAELLEQQDLEWVGDIDTTTRPGAVERPVELRAHHRHQQGERRRHQGRHAGRQRRRARRAGRAGHRDRSTVQLITDPDFAVGVRLLGAPGHRHRARARARRGPPRRHAASSPTPTTSPSRAPSRDHERRRPQRRSPPAIPVGQGAHRSARRAAGSTLDLVVRPDGRHRAAGLRHRAAVGAAGVIPPSPLIVAVRTSLVLVIALTIQLGVARRPRGRSACRPT